MSGENDNEAGFSTPIKMQPPMGPGVADLVQLYSTYARQMRTVEAYQRAQQGAVITDTTTATKLTTG